MSANDDPKSRSDEHEQRGASEAAAETPERQEPEMTTRELRPELDRATAKLRSALDDVCHTNVERANTGELIRVEEVLAIANAAAKEMISVRRRLNGDRRQSSADESPTAPAIAQAPSSREVIDAGGRQWRVFAVHPTSGRAVIRDAYAEGWLSFDAGDETRRLAPIPSAWFELADSELLTLLAGADVSPRRRRATDLHTELRTEPHTDVRVPPQPDAEG